MFTIPVGSPHTRIRRYSRRFRSGRRWAGLAKILAVATGVAGAGVLAVMLVGSPDGGRTATIPAGTELVGALEQTVSTGQATTGQAVFLNTTEPFHVNSHVTLPAGISIRGEVTHSKSGGRRAGAPELTLQFDEIEWEGRSYLIEAEPFRVDGKTDPLQRDRIVLSAGQKFRIRLSQPVVVQYSR